MILFAHGQCLDSNNRGKWAGVLAALARSGYIVIIPEVPHSTGHAPGQFLLQVLLWVSYNWVHKSLCDFNSVGVAGHSWGAATAAEAVTAAPGAFNAYASVSGRGGFQNDLNDIGVPKLLIVGTGLGESGKSTPFSGSSGVSDWNGITSSTKHLVRIHEGEHWDYVSAGLECQSDSEGSLSGPCPATRRLVSDILLTFFSKYMPPDPLLKSIPPSLEPPPQSDVVYQTYLYYNYANFLTGKTTFKANSACTANFHWNTPEEIGSMVMT